MARYAIGLAANVTATASAVRAEIRAAGTSRPRITEITVTNAAATVITLLLGRSAAIGVTPTSPLTVQALDPADPAGTTTTAIAWGTAPTITGITPLQRVTLPATIGAGMSWSFERGILLPLNGSLIFWNLAASSSAALDISIVIDE
ncbi:MAG TPA: hypothetical protein VNM48_03975 [Chloroflexota bacterium]|nr:hypothetical protein [Chloroflexota bacterium]